MHTNTLTVGHEEVMREAELMQGVPVAGPWALDGGRSALNSQKKRDTSSDYP